jgi:Leucine-rich repeat (LRR) protein
MQILDVSYTNIHRIHATRLKNLRTLFIAGCLAQIEEIATLNNLTHLDLSHCSLSDDHMKYLGALKLRILHLNYNELISEVCIDILPSSLERLNLGGCAYITGKKLDRFSKLRVLEVSDCDQICSVPALPELQYLDAAACSRLQTLDMREHVTCIIVPNSTSLCIDYIPPRVQSLDIRNTRASDATMRQVQRLLELKSLHAARCVFITHAVDLRHLKNLTDVDLSDCHWIDDNGLGLLPDSLRYLRIKRCMELTSIAHLPPNILSLNITASGRLRDFTCPSAVQTLFAASCIHLTDDALRALLQNTPSLTELDVRNCKKLTPGILDANAFKLLRVD